jgi:hypothetical protein
VLYKKAKLKGKYALMKDSVFPDSHLSVYHFCWHMQVKMNDKFHFSLALE